MKRLSYYMTILFYITIISCNDKHTVKKTVENSKKQFMVDIPDRIKNNTIQLSKIMELDSLMGLSSLVNGFNKRQVRIWIYNSSKPLQQTIQIVQDSSQWSINLIEAQLVIDSLGNLVAVNQKIYPKMPRSGWLKFYEQLEAVGLETLPDYSYLLTDTTENGKRRYNISTNPNTITIELSDLKQYRFFQYPSFELNKDKFEELRNLEKFFSYLEDDLAIIINR